MAVNRVAETMAGIKAARLTIVQNTIAMVLAHGAGLMKRVRIIQTRITTAAVYPGTEIMAEIEVARLTTVQNSVA